MKQPDLGRKIAELRKAKGFTQEELVEKCNLSVRTLQRIEAGEVLPRNYTIRLLFTALDYNIHESSEIAVNKFGDAGFMVFNRLGQFYRYIFDLFNLKTNKMKKITILSITFIVLALGLFALSSESKAQKAEKAIKAITDAQNNINKWVAGGQIDLIMTLYRDDACGLPTWCGKPAIREQTESTINNGFQILEFHILSISVGDTIAVEKYYQVYKYSGNTYKQKGLTEWRLTDGKWLIVNDIAANE